MGRRSCYFVLVLLFTAVLVSWGSVDTLVRGGTAPEMTAEQFGRTMASRVPTMQIVRVFTPADDPNSLLGRPNGYTSKIGFTDSRVPPDKLMGLEPGAVEAGGSIETWPDEDSAQRRADYISELGKAVPFAVEYDYVVGPHLVRVSRLLSPDQAAEYERAARAVAGSR